MRAWLIAGLLALGSPVHADDFVTTLNAAGAPFNAINLFLDSGSFGPTTPLVSFPSTTWSVRANTGNFVQIMTTTGSTNLLFSFDQSFLGIPAPPGTTLSYQVFNWNGASVVGTPIFGGLALSSTGGSSLNLVAGNEGGYSSSAPPGLIAPVPEPSCLLLCAVGAMGLHAWRRRGQPAHAG